MALAPAAAVAVSLLLAHGPVLASGLERVPGDPGDARLVNYFLEHTWLWLTGHPLHRHFWDLPMVASGERSGTTGRHSWAGWRWPRYWPFQWSMHGGALPRSWASAARRTSFPPHRCPGSTRARTAGGMAAGFGGWGECARSRRPGARRIDDPAGHAPGALAVNRGVGGRPGRPRHPGGVPGPGGVGRRPRPRGPGGPPPEHRSGRRTRRACLLEQGATFDHFVPAAERSRALSLGRSLPPGCSAFAYAPDADGWPAWRAQLDAAWATDAAGIPTLNGYTCSIPPGWPLEECLVRRPEDRARIEAAVAEWSARQGISGTVCLVPAW